MKRHPVADLFPLMSEEEFQALKADIQTSGLQDPCRTWKGQLIDGRHRLRACEELGIAPKFVEWTGEESAMVRFVVGLNLNRRHLTSSQKAAVAVDLEAMLRQLAEEAKERHRMGSGTRRNPSRSEQVPQQVGEPAPRSTESKSHAGETTERIATMTGTNRQYVADAQKLKEQAPDLHEDVKAGKASIKGATATLKRRKREAEKQEQLQAHAASGPGGEFDRWRIVHADCVQFLQEETPKESTRLIFADPPYNIGVDYGDGTGADLLPRAMHEQWALSWLEACRNALTADGSLWVLISDEYAAEYVCWIKDLGFTLRNWIIWYEEFGVYCAGKFGRCKRHLLYAVRNSNSFIFNADDLRVPSARQTLYDDARANPNGKVMDDVWTDIARLAGTHGERIPEFPTQLPIALPSRAIICASNAGDTILDPFNGSATTGVAALRLGRRYLGIEKQQKFADLARLRLRGECSGKAG